MRILSFMVAREGLGVIVGVLHLDLKNCILEHFDVNNHRFSLFVWGYCLFFLKFEVIFMAIHLYIVIEWK